MKLPIKRIIRGIIPDRVIHYGIKKWLGFKYNVKIGHKSVVTGCEFEGYGNYIARDCHILCCTIGYFSYISYCSNIYYAKIGRFCSIGDNVRIGLGSHPKNQNISTHPAFYQDVKSICGYTFHKDSVPLFQYYNYIAPDFRFLVEIGNDVWIGSNVTIIDGIRIGDGAIIGCGAVVTKDVKPYEIVAGVPARVIGKRFDDKTISELLNAKWWDCPIGWIRKNYRMFDDPENFVRNFKGSDGRVQDS